MIHVSLSGKKVPCKARTLPCPRGNAEHYPSVVLDLEKEGDTEKLTAVNDLISKPGFESEEKKRKWVIFLDTYYHFDENGEYTLNTELLDEKIEENKGKHKFSTDFIARLANVNPANPDLIDYIDDLKQKEETVLSALIIPESIYRSKEAVNYILAEKSDALKNSLLLGSHPHAIVGDPVGPFNRRKINPEVLGQLIEKVKAEPDSALAGTFLATVTLTEDEVNDLYSNGVRNQALASQKNISTDKLYDLSKLDGRAEPSRALRALIKRKDLNSVQTAKVLEHLNKRIKERKDWTTDSDLAHELLTKHKLPPRYVEKILSDGISKYDGPHVINNVLSYQDVTDSLDVILENPKNLTTSIHRDREGGAVEDVAYALSFNKYLSNEAVVDKILSHKEPGWTKAVTSNRNVYLSEEKMNGIIEENNPVRVKSLSTYRPLNVSQIDRVINSSNHAHDGILVRHQRLSSAQIDKIVSNPNLSAHELIANQYEYSVDYEGGILTQEHFSKSHLDKIEEKIGDDDSAFYSDIIRVSKKYQVSPALQEVRNDPALIDEYKKKASRIRARRAAQTRREAQARREAQTKNK